MRIFLLGLCVVFAAELSAQQAPRMIRYLDSTYAAAPFFANIIVKKGNAILIEKSYGYSNDRDKKALSPENVFQIASISKQFTAYGIMMLKHRGLLHYDSLVRKYLPQFPYDDITIRHLLTHSSGLPNFWDAIRPNLDQKKSNGNKEVLEYLVKHSLPLQSQPGTTYQYCDIGYDFLASIIETVSKKSYERFLQENIFDKLNMKRSHAYLVTDIRRIRNKNLAIGHARNKTNKQIEFAHLLPENDFVFYLGDFYGDGSIVTSARDLALWSDALKHCTLLPCEVQAEAFVPFSENGQLFHNSDAKRIDYGFGWQISSNKRSEKVISHGGGHPGNQHLIYKILDSDVTLIYLSNFENDQYRVITNRLIELL